MNVLMKVEGAEQLIEKLKKMQGKYAAEMAAALPAEGELLKAEANAMAPVATGQLVGSAIVSVETTRTGTKVAVAYTDPKAAAVHEGVHWGHHLKRPPPTLKWLQRALHSFQGGFIEHLAARLRKVAGG